ncbi:MAG: 1-deoxy-D-xylulose-5-phosphate reductoisomerase [Candidatus Woesearchaeota archaeon]|jgi:1-deoxy-D-xylulose-5-phosphate reductoisomerase|nr:1-deoxy-D-xylulose-5-phosphate reductoisomerase [Candidatus Woesearchaeota archaeon]|tara:strand:- start:31 stop:1161 length:1131 start_codon:yes stop_codon:yes gene_type:complete
MKTLSILGSTGSIGTQTLELVRNNPNEFKVLGLTVNKNIELLKQQIDEFNPVSVAVMDEQKADELKVDIPVYKGLEGINKIATLQESNTIINSLVGSIGVIPTIKAIKEKKNIALANKETLVTAGDIVMEEVRKHQVNLMPIDSEHSAIFQCLNGEKINELKKIIITCSGGAFKNKTEEELKTVTAKDALKHPTWNMGAKITIDSATLMNKGFEVIEAHHLYNIPYEQIEVIIHPESIIHSLVEFQDTSIIAQLGYPDMKIPIQYALTYPKRIKNNLKSLNLNELKQLNFKTPNHQLFPCLNYAYEAGKTKGTLPAVLNAANEVAVQQFLENKISFLDIAKTIKQALDSHNIIKNPDLAEILEVDKQTRENASLKS